MKFEKLEIADLLADESFINYCRRSSPDDIKFWEDYLKENPDRRAAVEYASERFTQLFNALGDADLEEQVTRLKNRLDSLDTAEPAPVVQMEKMESRTARRKGYLLLKFTAAAALLAALFFTVRYFSYGRTNDTKVFLAAYGERKNIQLPDGTDVTLNAGSKIEIKGSFGVSGRDVYLEGEAFFDVKHNANLPFVVHTLAMDVKALGTAFNVKAYLDEKTTETSLIRGLIEVTLKESNNRTMLLYPNQKIEWENPRGQAAGPSSLSGSRQAVPAMDIQVKKLVASEEGNIKEIAWKDKKLMFDDELFADIAILLERWYGVDIEFRDEAIRFYRFTGIYEKEDITTVLDFLRESKKFNYEMQPGDPLKISLSK